MENFEVRAKSFTIKWVNVPDNCLVKWELKPLKRSVNFAIYEYNRADLPAPTTAPNSSSTTTSENLSLDEVNEVPHKMFNLLHQNLRDSVDSINSQNGVSPSTPTDQSAASLSRSSSLSTLPAGTERRRRSDSSISVNDPRSSLEDKIDKHLAKKQWIGRCEGDKLTTGTFEVETGSLFAFIFDNTFSRHKAKTIMFNQYIESNGVVHQTQELPNPSSSGQLNTIDEQKSIEETDVPQPGESIGSAIERPDYFNTAARRASTASVSAPPGKVRFNVPENGLVNKSKNVSLLRVKGGQYLQGFLLKKKRRRGGKNFARRYFVLNFKYGVLDYFFNDLTNHVRGNMYIRNVVISADPKQLMMYLDSGIEQWVLKASTSEDFKIWVQAFNFIKKQNKTSQPGELPEQILQIAPPTAASDDSDVLSHSDDSRIGRPRSVTNPQYKLIEEKIIQVKELAEHIQTLSKQQSTKKPPTDRRGSFFRKKNKKEAGDDIPEQESVNGSYTPSITGTSVYDTLVSEIRDLQLQYLLLVNTETNRGFSKPAHSPSRRTLTRTNTAATSVVSQEFFDAQEYMDEMTHGVYLVQSSDEGEDGEETKDLSNGAQMSSTIFDKSPFETPLGAETSNTSSSSDEDDDTDQKEPELLKTSEFTAPEDLYPLESGKFVDYRKDIKACTSDPPSLIGFLRKNIGKDISSVSMPVTANEPLTFLQKYSESFEYSHLLTDALRAPADTGERILMVATFAISYLSSFRAKIRSVRKPFTPLLGETFELVRNDLGIRMICEKVVHRPIVVGAHVESTDWTIDHILSSQQKYGGKSAEVSVLGDIELKCRNGQVYKWSQPTTLIKNLIAGEKYSEPYASVTIFCNDGQRAVVSFKAVGMFSGRSEELNIKAFNADGSKYAKEVNGTWTDSLRFSDTNEKVWKVGNLVPNYQKKYGFTEFAASLNQITEVEEGCAPTDSRLRPDQRKYEEGEVDEAEDLKLKLENDQRKRRKNPDGTDAVHTPAFFKKTGDGDFDWEYIDGEQSYWNRRKAGDWSGLVELW
ncbi:hypothetical protein OGAPHI_004821 [Ogataea philodendri]|uniref:PH domain-containing protein n=1 Tax=Ogataea philodendri TaxID=1378263 RepID=A0A9P8P3D3_9ASCO|nr:uncharacterized protein OGAPHI_004821 [Ogataea philodendri]KAH3664107.1 hypothetical protein OGAPHI_004821 [Ogataea philodendri]